MGRPQPGTRTAGAATAPRVSARSIYKVSSVDQHDRPAPTPDVVYFGDDPSLNGEPELEWDDESEFVTARPAAFRVLRSVVAVVILAAIGYVAYTNGRDWFAGQIDPEGEPGAAVLVSIPSGATTADIGSILTEEAIIPNSTFFRYYAQWKDQGNFQAGEYTFAENMSADEAIEVLLAGPTQIEYGEFVVPEGLWVDEMMSRISRQVLGVSAADLQAVLDSGQLTPRYRPEGVNSWEGLLFPSKYFIEEGIAPVEVLGKMNDEFARVTGELGYGAAERKHGLSAYEVIVIASLVEAEAKTDADRPKIARVIYNRLRDNEPIGIDATYLYALGDRRAQLTDSILKEEGPFNTRYQVGLPPTPIATPGKASLEAAMNPAEGEWKWYVLADEQGNHFFTDSYDAFVDQKAISEDAGLLGE